MELKLLFLLLTAVPFIIIMVTKPKIGFYGFLLARPIIDSVDTMRTQNIVGSINALQAIGILWPCLLITVCFFKGVNFWKYRTVNLCLLFTFLCLPSIFLSTSWIEAGADWMKLFTLWAVLIFVLHSIENEKDIKTIFLVILCASFYPMLLFIISFVQGETLLKTGIERVVGGYFHMGPISFLLFLFMPAYLFFLSSSKNNLKRVLLLAGFTFLLVCIYKTYYRSTLIGVLVFLSSYSLLKKKYLVLSGLALAASLVLILSPFLQDRYAQLVDVLGNIPFLFDRCDADAKYDYLMSGRFGIWRVILTIYRYQCDIQNLLFGFGYKVVVNNLLIVPHNDFLNICFQNGFMALLAFIAFLGSAILTGIHSIKENTSKIVLSLLIASTTILLATNFFVSVRVALYMGTYIALLIRGVELKSTPENKNSGGDNGKHPTFYFSRY